MRAFTAIKRIKLLVVLSLFLVSGCAQNAYSVKEDSVSGSDTVTLRDVTVAGEGYQTKIVISADKPLTYTLYSLKEPHRTIIDLSQTKPGTAVVPQLAANSLIKSIDLSGTELTGGTLTRLTVETAEEVEFVVSNETNDKTKLVVAIPSLPVAGASVSAPSKSLAAVTPSSSVDAVSLTSAAPDAPVVNNDVSYHVVSSNPSPEISSTAPQATPSEAALIALDVTNTGIAINTGLKLQKYKYFELSNPQRLVVDLYNVKNNLAAKSLPISRFGVENARLGAYPDKVRIVFDSQNKVFPRYTLEKTDNGLLVRFDDQQSAAMAPVRTTPITRSASSEPAAGGAVKRGASSVEFIDFKVIGDISRVSISLEGECEVAGPTKTSEGLVLTFSKCLLPKHLQRPFDTSAFASVVKKITPYQVTAKGHRDTKIQVSLREDSAYSLKKEGNVFNLDIENPPHSHKEAMAPARQVPVVVSGARIIEPTPPAASTSPALNNQGYVQDETNKKFGKKAYTGKRVTLEFADADIRKIFQLIAEVSNLNILVGDDVSGTISIKLVNVPWDQALDVILETKGLGMKRAGNIVLIKPKEKIVSLADEELAATRAYERTLELRTRIFDINFASVTDVAGQFQSFKSERGTISVDNRTNRVIVTDVEPAIEKMANLLKALDIPEKQVLIEARIVEASSSFAQDLGIQWGIHYRDASASTLGINSLNTGFGGIVTNVASATGLPAASAAGGALGLSFGKLTSNIQVDLRLSAAAENGQVKIISTPKVVTLNNKSAKISQGQMIPYSTVSAEGTKTEFVEAALTLEVTPHITADGNVSMKIKATNNSAGSAATGVAPPINKKEATTELLVQSGETTVIGGIYVDTETNTDSGVPFLMDIPILGWLFKSNNQQKTKSELLIFITPKIVS
ncbi:MAG: type IV pilus secretin family protein [Deltaproteobacteria bacterium]|nr:type IV pilus secretin family protein [Deltaproteobacteria bacterium]TLN05135.1 MAG: type IV pilus secretin PilQ [bacterium]